MNTNLCLYDLPEVWDSAPVLVLCMCEQDNETLTFYSDNDLPH